MTKRRLIGRKKKVSSSKKKFKVPKELDLHIRTILSSVIYPIVQRMNQIVSEMNQVKSNLITTQNILQKQNLLDEKKYYPEFEKVSEELFGKNDGEGGLVGNPVFSIYEEDD